MKWCFPYDESLTTAKTLIYSGTCFGYCAFSEYHGEVVLFLDSAPVFIVVDAIANRLGVVTGFTVNAHCRSSYQIWTRFD